MGSVGSRTPRQAGQTLWGLVLQPGLLLPNFPAGAPPPDLSQCNATMATAPWRTLTEQWHFFPLPLAPHLPLFSLYLSTMLSPTSSHDDGLFFIYFFLFPPPDCKLH